MKVRKITFGAWSSGDGGFRDELYVYDIRGVDSYLAEQAIDGNGEGKILVHDIGNGNLLITYSLGNFRFCPRGVVGEGYAFVKSSFEDFLVSLEDWEVCESCEGYSLRKISEEEVELV